jgi:hypothetical protein
MWELSREAWERFLAGGDGSALLNTFRYQAATGVDAKYPALHRLRDVLLEGAAYRVCRQVDLESGQERLFIDRTDVPDCDGEGVPYRLQGDALLAWVEDELEHPAKGEVDWDAYY